ncbi:uncharacterized protein Bfra_006590 [Botrytis fragariae]|uniref:Uncharacterized protein n=1 Tax=Botrytis fragariae TaxID=1964551 RepID=A0A8H6B4S9_9HELO|nr:uncharacterized protein Bfra_006590 [Botrytis fragariae]KAF5879381.1 hypothetical protein Bfra_006590 [Botrytis fragariae]
MSQSSYFDLENVSFNPPAPPIPTTEASETQLRTVDSLNIRLSNVNISDSSRELPREHPIPEFPLYDRLPQETRCEIMYQAALKSEPRIISIDIQTRLHSPTTRRPSDQIDAFLQVGGRQKMQEEEFKYLTITRGCGWHARDQLILDQFYFRPEKDILWFSEQGLENYQNINIYPSGSVKRLAISVENLQELLILYKGHFSLDPPKHSSLFIGQLRNLEHIYVVVPHYVSIKEMSSGNRVLVDSDEPSAFARNILLMWWFSWLEKESENIGRNPPEISFKQFHWRGISEE